MRSMRRARGRAWCWATSSSPRTTSLSGAWSRPSGPSCRCPAAPTISFAPGGRSGGHHQGLPRLAVRGDRRDLRHVAGLREASRHVGRTQAAGKGRLGGSGHSLALDCVGRARGGPCGHTPPSAPHCCGSPARCVETQASAARSKGQRAISHLPTATVADLLSRVRRGEGRGKLDRPDAPCESSPQTPER